MENCEINFEFEARYCPICGKHIKAGDPFHRCKDEDLKKIDKKNKDKEIKEERTYGDKLEEFEKYYNQDVYYNQEEE